MSEADEMCEIQRNSSSLLIHLPSLPTQAGQWLAGHPPLIPPSPLMPPHFFHPPPHSRVGPVRFLYNFGRRLDEPVGRRESGGLLLDQGTLRWGGGGARI